jgi:hypothetical protein
VPRPAPSIRPIATRVVKLPAGVRLKLDHDPLGINLGLHDDMYMVRPHMCGQQVPAAVRAVLPQSRQYCLPPVLVEPIGRLRHLPAFRQGALRIGFHQAASKQIVALIH